MAITASASANVTASPQQLLEFVLDVERYKEADKKITRVSKAEAPDPNGEGSIKIWGKLKGLPPAPDVQNYKLNRWESLTFTGAPRQPGRLVFDFVGTFVCEPEGDSTRITHAYEFVFKGPFKLLEKRLTPWLQAEIEAEVNRIAVILGG